MKHEDRRKELSKMLLDVAKYLATVGLIGSLLTNSLSALAGMIVTVEALAKLSYCVIPNEVRNLSL